MMKYNIQKFGFDFYPRCWQLEISHLIFADDLFLLSAGTKLSMIVFKHTMEDFEAISGLRSNLQKCNLFAVSNTNGLYQEFFVFSGINKAIHPVTYLGVPLLSSKLGNRDCNVLVDKMVKRLKSWANKKLSYRGRL
ncbi:hypothetical protein ACH5RR_021402 [Cinchona calisaya]|uniref:Reverse transcriptase n=1 Tax=Cinchona calisaya TaxID=153742 RepID=A0ABD2ZIF8_9GENT